MNAEQIYKSEKKTNAYTYDESHDYPGRMDINPTSDYLDWLEEKVEMYYILLEQKNNEV